MYCGVPMLSPVAVSRDVEPLASSASAIPKSAISALTLVQEDVLRLHVAVHDAVAVRVVEGAGDVCRDAHGVGAPAAAPRGAGGRAAIRLPRYGIT